MAQPRHVTILFRYGVGRAFTMRNPGVTRCLVLVERVTRIELALSAWEADVLPLNYTRGGAPAGQGIVVPGGRAPRQRVHGSPRPEPGGGPGRRPVIASPGVVRSCPGTPRT